MSRVCMCDRLSPEGVHTSKLCPFYGMHWSEVATALEATDRENGSGDA